MLAISGLHITLLGMGVCKGLRFLGVPALIAAMLGGGFLVLYGNMVGFGISVCRAIGMYLVRVLGEILQRDYDMLTAMGVLALGIALSNPAVLTRCDYLLSFGAVTALGIVLPSFGPGDAMVIRPLENRYLYCIRRSIGKCREMLRVSVSISLFTLPIQLFFFFEAPMYGVMVNLLVLPLISVLIGSVFGALLCPFSFPFVWMGCLLLGLFQRVCILSTSLPGHLLVTGKPGGVRICLYYAVLLAGVMLGYREQKEGHKKVSNEKRGDMPWRAFWIALLLIIMIFPWGRGFTMHVISVGQGECIMVENGKGQTYLFDCGSSSVKDLTSVLLPYFKYYGITKLDGVFLSHGDQDHICGLEGLLQKENKLKIQNIYLPVGEKGNEYETILSLAKEQRIPVKEIGQGDQFVWKNTKLTCLYPGSACDKGSGNERSACFLWEVGKRYFLLTGDLEGEGEEEVMKLWKEKQGIDVLKVAHHGSRYSTGEEFLHTFRPRIAVISVGERNSYHHPHEETLERLEKQKITYYRTDRMGEIVIGVNKGEIYVKTWKK